MVLTHGNLFAVSLLKKIKLQRNVEKFIKKYIKYHVLEVNIGFYYPTEI